MFASTRSRFFIITLLTTLIVLSALTIPTAAYADTPVPPPDNGNCITCHDNLYYLHDTGKYYCLNESPMSCVDCHGGNSQATTQEEAHTLRAAHPIINEDISKCQGCHPEQCVERIDMFDQMAGFSDIVLVAGPSLPQFPAEQSVPVPATVETGKNNWLLLIMEAAAVLLIIGLAMAFYIHHRTHKA